ncbi:hypothetical protein [Nocardia paucivorans]|uniref:hypothetical protein n=1 Tax=Nocardia paucivorans TaxID=114259 RepID=UPI0002FD9EB3|nr:hypothetical protein [Nocardia paucivorans]
MADIGWSAAWPSAETFGWVPDPDDGYLDADAELSRYADITGGVSTICPTTRPSLSGGSFPSRGDGAAGRRSGRRYGRVVATPARLAEIAREILTGNRPI